MLVIGIAGGTGSGKTTVAHAVMNKLGTDNVTLLTQDNYYFDRSEYTMEQRNSINYDHPDSMDHQLLIEHIHELRMGRSVELPVYDFSKHAHSSETLHISVKPVVLVEGIHVLTEADIRKVLDIKVFVDTDPDVRVLRRLVRDIQVRGRSLESVHKQYLTTVKPMHDAFIEPSKKYADIIIPEGGNNEIGIDLLTNHIKRYIKKYMANLVGTYDQRD